MKKQLPILQVIILMFLDIIFISSCDYSRSKANNNLNIDFKITGSNQIWIDNSNGMIHKTKHLIEDNFLVGRNILNNPSLVSFNKLE